MDYKISLFSSALAFAATAHAGQFDKSGKEPYILHPLRIEAEMRKRGYDEATRIVALLHDVVEDTPVELWQIENTFGSEVADGVRSVSRAYIRVLPGAGGIIRTFKPTPEYTKEIYKDFIRRAKKHSIGRFVKIYDIRDNMSPERVAGLAEEERGIVASRYIPALNFLESPLDKY